MSEIELVKRLRNATGAVSETALCAEAADAIEALTAALEDWLTYAEECLPDFDGAVCETEWPLCRECEPAGCINMKIREARAALRKVRP